MFAEHTACCGGALLSYLQFDVSSALEQRLVCVIKSLVYYVHMAFIFLVFFIQLNERFLRFDATTPAVLDWVPFKMGV